MQNVIRRHDECDEMPRSGMITISEAAERARWAAAFGVSESVLEHAVRIVGASVAELRQLFCRD
jgi:hypothetical protein